MRGLIIRQQLPFDTLNRKIGSIGTLGVDLMAYRLLHTRLPVIPRWDMVRHIAARLARKAENTKETYSAYVKKLCVRASQSIALDLSIVCRGSGGDYTARDHEAHYYEYDVVVAAAYLNELSIIKELATHDHNLHSLHGPIDDPFFALLELRISTL